MAYQKCVRCVMDNASDTAVRFDAEGCCNYCSDALSRISTEYLPNKQGKQLLDEMIRQMKKDCKEDPYDCLVGVSGGIDSSYILYLGYHYDLRMLAVHVDDGLDNPIAVENIRRLTEKTNTKLVVIQPHRKEYANLLKALLKASVPNLAIAQDNLIIKSLEEYGKNNGVRYSLDGSNFAHESILERGSSVNNCDRKYILSIQKRFGDMPIEHLEFVSLVDRYLKRRYMSSVKHIRPLNYISYNLQGAIDTLQQFCGFEYYGGKHYESILTRFMQCYYLPEKFGIDKRKSHYSSLIVSGQMTREEALERMKEPLYISEELLQEDKKFLADYVGVSLEEFEHYIALPPKQESSYPHSVLNKVAPVARKFRKWIE